MVRVGRLYGAADSPCIEGSGQFDAVTQGNLDLLFILAAVAEDFDFPILERKQR